MKNQKQLIIPVPQQKQNKLLLTQKYHSLITSFSLDRIDVEQIMIHRKLDEIENRFLVTYQNFISVIHRNLRRIVI